MHVATSVVDDNDKTATTNSARIVSPDSLSACGARLRNGDLVAFPTETVYGLGCHALDPVAIQKVFQAKERPLTDPLIVHVTHPSDAQSLWQDYYHSTTTSNPTAAGAALECLCQTFWPGPLTLVAKAAPHVPSILMAHTGFVACRSPSHPLARALLQEAQVPIAAPSANKFGHVSPTRASHVWDDLQHEDVWILQDHQQQQQHPSDDDDDDTNLPCCQVGVESTVAKLEWDGETGTVTVLRQGQVSREDIQLSLKNAGLGNFFSVILSSSKPTTPLEATVAPGQLLRHYSPDIPSVMVSCARCQNDHLSLADQSSLASTVVIDFGCRFSGPGWKQAALAYRDLSVAGKSDEAAQAIFETLRWAEQVPGATRIIFPQLISTTDTTTDALTLAIQDRLTRAASGEVIDSLVL